MVLDVHCRQRLQPGENKAIIGHVGEATALTNRSSESWVMGITFMRPAERDTVTKRCMGSKQTIAMRKVGMYIVTLISPVRRLIVWREHGLCR